mmetsp:Transcript_90136/g.291697  ORF Transcript_90136/g.291697 Transcript_90136/m.291697 type:complete len:236 (-) Transcript_90136:701-1408(-)
MSLSALSSAGPREDLASSGRVSGRVSRSRRLPLPLGGGPPLHPLQLLERREAHWSTRGNGGRRGRGRACDPGGGVGLWKARAAEVLPQAPHVWVVSNRRHGLGLRSGTRDRTAAAPPAHEVHVWEARWSRAATDRGSCSRRRLRRCGAGAVLQLLLHLLGQGLVLLFELLLGLHLALLRRDSPCLRLFHFAQRVPHQGLLLRLQLQEVAGLHSDDTASGDHAHLVVGWVRLVVHH